MGDATPFGIALQIRANDWITTGRSTASLQPARERPARSVDGEWMPEGYRDAIAAPPSLLDAGAVAY